MRPPWAAFALACAAPLLALTPVDESSFQPSIARHKGKVVLVNFWATWCVPCQAELPALSAMARRLAPQGLVLATVSADEPEEAETAAQVLSQHRFPGPSYLKRAKNDDAFIRVVDPAWSGALPALVLYDRLGRKARMWVGETDLKRVEASVVKLLRQ